MTFTYSIIPRPRPPNRRNRTLSTLTRESPTTPLRHPFHLVHRGTMPKRAFSFPELLVYAHTLYSPLPSHSTPPHYANVFSP